MENERRQYRRLPLKLNVVCQKVGVSSNRIYSGMTFNVSTGGLLIEMRSDALKQGELVSVDLTVPPTDGLLEFGGSFSSYARVLRSHPAVKEQTPDHVHLVALEFCQSPSYRV